MAGVDPGCFLSDSYCCLCGKEDLVGPCSTCEVSSSLSLGLSPQSSCLVPDHAASFLWLLVKFSLSVCEYQKAQDRFTYVLHLCICWCERIVF